MRHAEGSGRPDLKTTTGLKHKLGSEVLDLVPTQHADSNHTTQKPLGETEDTGHGCCVQLLFPKQTTLQQGQQQHATRLHYTPKQLTWDSTDKLAPSNNQQ